MKRILIFLCANMLIISGCRSINNTKSRQIKRDIQQQQSERAAIANVFYQQGQFKKSKQVFEELLKQKNLSPQFRTELKNNYACVLNQMGNQKDAQKIWMQLTEDPYYQTKEVAWFNLGMLDLQEHRNKKALHNFSQALKYNSSYVDAFFFQAQAHLSCHDPIQAKSSLKKLLALAPDHKAGKQLLKKISIA